MQRSRVGSRRATGAAGSSAAVVLACIVAACGGGDAPKAGSHVGAPAQVVCPGVDVATLSPVFVSPQGSDGLCSAAAPCKSITYALQFANYWGYKAVVLRHGLYQTSETIDLKGGISLYGSCRFDGEPDKKYRSVIQASPAAGTPAILASGVSATVSGVVVLRSDETAGGNASVAMTAASANVTLARTVLVAGKGGIGGSVPPVGAPAAVRVGADRCYTPGGVASDLSWGQVDIGSFNWVAGIGGSGSNAGAYDTGPGGVGGQQGGASIGLLLVNSAVVSTVADEFNRVIGGFGGTGGAGQPGPSFGLGGGANSGGAGGNGGPSIGIAAVNWAKAPNDGVYAYANAAGSPGAGGAAGVDAGQCSGDPGAPGAPGVSAAVHAFLIPSTLTPGESLAGGQSLYSPKLQYQLTLRGDSNLCLVAVGNANPLWCSQTQGTAIYQAIMQADGNFCMYENAQQMVPVCSGSAGHPGARLTVQDSGHAQVIASNGTVLWSVP